MSSKSHTSPTPSASESSWLALDRVGQLSHWVPTLSPSMTQAPPPVQTPELRHGIPAAVPPEQAPSSCCGLYRKGQLSGGDATPSLSRFEKLVSAVTPSRSPSHSGSM